MADDVVASAAIEKAVRDRARKDSLFARHVITASEHDSTRSTFAAAQSQMVASEDESGPRPPEIGGCGGRSADRRNDREPTGDAGSDHHVGDVGEWRYDADDRRRSRARAHARDDRRSGDGRTFASALPATRRGRCVPRPHVRWRHREDRAASRRHAGRDVLPGDGEHQQQGRIVDAGNERGGHDQGRGSTTFCRCRSTPFGRRTSSRRWRACSASRWTR